MNIFESVRKFLRNIRRSPATPVFLMSFVVYYAIAIILILKTNLIEYSSDLRAYDLYFNFDHTTYFDVFSIYPSGFNTFRHPFLKIMAAPLIIVLTIVEKVAGIKGKALLLTAFTSGAVSLSVAYVYKYLAEVVRLEGRFRRAMLTGFFAAFATNLIVCFTPESFPFSLMLLTIGIYYFSIHIVTGENISLLKVSLLTIAGTGVTITNAVKCFVPVLFLRKGLNEKIRIVAIMLAALFATYLFHLACMKAYDVVYSKYVEKQNFIYNPIAWVKKEFSRNQRFYMSQTSRVNEPFLVPYPHAAISYFFGFPILFSDRFTTTSVFKDSDSDREQINTLTYEHPAYYIVVSGLILLILLSAWMNRTQRPVQMLSAVFAWDILLHLVKGFGFYEAFIYGSHWVFVVPWFLGWLYISLSQGSRKTLDVVLGALLIFTIANNARGLTTFISLAFQYY